MRDYSSSFRWGHRGLFKQRRLNKVDLSLIEKEYGDVWEFISGECEICGTFGCEPTEQEQRDLNAGLYSENKYDKYGCRVLDSEERIYRVLKFSLSEEKND